MVCVVPQLAQVIQLADTMPLAEAGTPQPGQLDTVPRADHRHPRLTSAQVGQLDGTGTATVMFTRTFTAEPAVTVLAVEDDTKAPPDFKVRRFLDDTGAAWTAGKPYGGCVIYGTRTRPLPTLNAITDLLGGVVGKLTGFVPTEPAAGVKFSIIALQPS